jgi:hypothetical protein
MRTNVENRKKGHNKKLIIQCKIQRFINIGTNYQPYHVHWLLTKNLFISEEMLKEGADCSDFFGPLFNFNRIIKS